MDASFLHRILIVWGTVALGACAATSAVDDSAPLAADEGVLVVGLSSNWAGGSVWLGTNLLLQWQALPENPYPGSQVRLETQPKQKLQAFVLRAGTYHWFGVGGRAYIETTPSGFTVKPGVVTYIGDLQLDSRCTDCVTLPGWIKELDGDVEITDGTPVARQFLAERFPKFNTLPFETSITTLRLARKKGNIIESP